MAVVELRAATRSDLLEFFGAVPASMRAIVARVDGEIMGIAGIKYTAAGLVAFSDAKPGAERFPVSMVRMARMLVKIMGDIEAPIYALSSQPTAPALLERLGFVQTQNPEVYKWHKQQSR